MDSARLKESLTNAQSELFGRRNAAGHWEGRLATSALSTATALVALGLVDETTHRQRILAACRWLVDHQNADGGWGDTDKSFSNLSTTLLCWSALVGFGAEDSTGTKLRASYWIRDHVGSLDPDKIAETVKARYGKDRTFSVPILMHCAICGTLGPRGWRQVLPLPFVLAAFPRTWFAAMRLPVVSYALPALIAIGYARYKKFSKFPHPLWPRVSRLLASIQPASGGFLEAAPLTSFVTMALVSAGEAEHPVVNRAVRFLIDSVREDGSWPIDTNLATWVTTLAVRAFATTGEGRVGDSTLFDSADRVRRWLLGQQYRERHPFTDAAPGGWAWTDLSGGVPDADDTPGALLALKALGDCGPEIVASAGAGVEWLLDLQNRDGGMPTFCRGWGALPFDRSSPDLTAHALRAWRAWKTELPGLAARIERAEALALAYLRREQRADGSWHPLWFGNQHRSNDEANPVYGTAMVLHALAGMPGCEAMCARAVVALQALQSESGGWGPAFPTIEETALATGALARWAGFDEKVKPLVERGVSWLIEATQSGRCFEPSPIGFYFAKLWYYEDLYPLVWTVEALGYASLIGESEEVESAPNRLRKPN